MKVVLLGGTGYAGKKVLDQLLSKGLYVTLLTRSSAKVLIKNQRLEVIEGNVSNQQVLDRLLKNQDAVINCLGIGGKGNGKPNDFVSKSTLKLVKSMNDNKVNRLICMSNVGAGDSYLLQPYFFRRIILPLFMKWLKVIIDDKNKMEPIIMSSNLDWTIVRCPNIINKKTKNQITISQGEKKLKFSITNNDLSVFLVEQLTDKKFIRKTISISN